ncbi:hypothetical protein [[Mycobacterium] wendilense]|uniref:Chitin-binding type-2 domain-containing protein n=1 Tax=[Mycobacterium] wendilense TaxID=3064284 RepID=A0ABN9PAB0_9MYCO|nr:hypothetical protein [Mycolicibacterium sp. MU0050]CAJ1585995.1 hypothetical protein MU0050_004027 [Mycolicibacterium sp. MU0050]
MQRLAVGAVAAAAPLMFPTLVTPGVASAECAPGEWWDPVANRCQPPLVPNCENGWWDPGARTCRPPVSTTPLGCLDGWWWDPIENVCRPPLFGPQAF